MFGFQRSKAQPDEAFVIRFSQIPPIESFVQLMLGLTQRPGGDAEEPNELLRIVSAKAFGGNEIFEAAHAHVKRSSMN